MIQFEKKNRRHSIKPVQFVCLSFFLLIMAGTLLLMLPIASKTGDVTNPLDALFTATSATCVTGLTVMDIYSHWTVFGQTVIILLIQLGGLGLLTFTTFFALFFRRKVGLKNLRVAGEQMSIGIEDVNHVLSRIITITFVTEGIGAFLLMLSFIPKFGAGGIWMAVFTAVSAYCNAGFDVFGFISPFCNLIPFAGDWIVMLVVPTLIICGGLGFFVFNDIITSRRRGKVVHHLSLHSKTVLIMTGILLAIAIIIYMLLEYHGSMGDLSFADKVGVSFFSAATPRTAGFSMVDYSQTHELTRLLTIVLMFIGASPTSTGGGIKTSTAMVLIMTVYSVLRGKSDTIIFGKRVDKTVVYKAFAITMCSLFLVMVSVIIMSLCEPDYSFLNLLFECTSAFSTTGLSAVGTQNLGNISRIILILLMYIGRVGPLSFILTLNLHGQKDKSVTIPEGKILVG